MEDLYDRYQRDGAPTSMDFPGVCPEPDFAQARAAIPSPPSLVHRVGHRLAAPPRSLAHRLRGLPRSVALRLFGHGRHARHQAYAVGALLIGLAGLGLGLAVTRRRWRRFTPRP